MKRQTLIIICPTLEGFAVIISQIMGMPLPVNSIIRKLKSQLDIYLNIWGNNYNNKRINYA